MTDDIRSRRLRPLATLAAGLATVMALSGCTLIQEIQELGGTTPMPGEGLEVVPEDLDATLSSYYEQELEWAPCDTSVGAPSDAECATVLAPMDWSAPDAYEDIQLALIRLPATGTSQGSMFTNPGGPGGSGLSFIAGSGTSFFSKDLREKFDIVSWDPRGVGASSAVDCVDDAGMDEYLYGVPENAASMTPEELVAFEIEKTRKFTAGCLENTGDLLAFVDTQSTVRDLDLLRALVGDRTLTYFGLSYGTDIGAQYIDKFPDRVGRVVLDGATDPTVPAFDVIIDQQEKFGDATRNYLADCFTAAECPFAGPTVDDAIGQIRATMDEVDSTLPKGPDGRTFTSSVMLTAINMTMYDSSSWQYLSQAFSAWYTAADSSVFFFLADLYNDRDQSGHYASNMMEAFQAINCLDYPLVTDKDAIRSFYERLAEVSIFFSLDDMTEAEMAIGDLTCENWPVRSKVTEQQAVTGAGAAPVLVVATSNDPATPLKWAEAVAQQLESATLLVVEGDGHIAYGRSTCGDQVIDEYFISGKVPADPTHC